MYICVAHLFTIANNFALNIEKSANNMPNVNCACCPTEGDSLHSSPPAVNLLLFYSVRACACA